MFYECVFQLLFLNYSFIYYKKERDIYDRHLFLGFQMVIPPVGGGLSRQRDGLAAKAAVVKEMFFSAKSEEKRMAELGIIGTRALSCARFIRWSLRSKLP